MNYKERLGNKIKEMRTNLGESAEEFGKRFDPVASRANISSWESGKYLPNGKRLKVIADMHDTTVTKLLYDETKQEKLFGVYETFFNHVKYIDNKELQQFIKSTNETISAINKAHEGE